jgi:hypothetical protein
VSEPVIEVRRDSPVPERPWRVSLVTMLTPGGTGPGMLVGFYPTHPEALMRGITAARFVDAGVAWRPEGLPDVEVPA